MPVGLQVFDASSNLVFDSNDRLARIVGWFSTSTVGGSITLPSGFDGQPWAIAIRTSAGASDIDFNFVSDGFSWEPPSTNHFVVYGVY